MKATITKTKIGSTNGEHYYRVRIYYGKGVKSKYISLNDLKFWNTPKTIEQKKTNKLNKEILLDRIEALKRQVNSKNYNHLDKKENFMDHVDFVARNRGGSSIKNLQLYATTKKHLLQYCSNNYKEQLQVSDIDYDFCIGFRTYLKNTYSLRSSYNKLSESSQNSYFVRFCVIMNDAVSRGLIDSSPTSKVKAPAIPDKEITYLTLEEIEKLHATSCDNKMLKKAFLFAFYTGLRKGDIESLKWKHLPVINSQTELDLITSKKGVRLTFKVPKQAVEALPTRGEDEAKVFLGFKYDGYQNEKLRRWILEAGIKKKNVGSHTARHSFAVYHLSKGTPIYTLSKLMAHNSVKTTERSYAQYAKEDLNYALEKAFSHE